eukprot:TRINITY_DN11162_c0_g1_i1.p1 TRINITY_DN11162_c0_g1~~TRINITY_DN11162_c0_g1_i1.p1  ORF type:complete len:451 (+),score=45.82 TRINITY_DN11162_c0_g1_i1:58-1353(+)
MVQQNYFASMLGPTAHRACSFCVVSHTDYLSNQPAEQRTAERSRRAYLTGTHAERRALGLAETMSPLLDEDLDLDVHSQATGDFLHIVLLGLFPLVLQHLLSALSAPVRRQVEHAVSAVRLPPGSKKILSSVEAMTPGELASFAHAAVGVFRERGLPLERLRSLKLICRITLICVSMHEVREEEINWLESCIEEFCLLQESGAFAEEKNAFLRPKCHTLRHLVDFIRLYGPPRVWGTEAGESKHRALKEQRLHCRTTGDITKALSHREMRVEFIRHEETKEKPGNLNVIDPTSESEPIWKPAPGDDIVLHADGELWIARITSEVTEGFKVKWFQRLTQKAVVIFETGARRELALPGPLDLYFLQQREEAQIQERDCVVCRADMQPHGGQRWWLNAEFLPVQQQIVHDKSLDRYVQEKTGERSSRYKINWLQ